MVPPFFAPSGTPWMVFGRETEGLGAALLEREKARSYLIPILPTVRSLNLANACSVVLYDQLRRSDFEMGEAAVVDHRGAGLVSVHAD